MAVGRRAAGRAGFWLVFWREWRLLLRRPFLVALAVVMPLALMAALTAVFSAGIATDLPIAVLDLDGSELSRSLTRMVDAAPDVHIVQPVADLAEGRGLILSGRAHGLLLMPRHLERDVLAGRRPEVVFFYNSQTMTTGNLVLRAVNAAIPAAAAGLRVGVRTAHGQSADMAVAGISPIPVQTHALFNPTLNYAHFLLAALLPSVLQVVVVTVAACSVGLDVESRRRLRVLRRMGGGIWSAMAAKLLPYTVLFLVVLGVADSVLFGWLGLPLHGQGWLVLVAGVLFILACQLMGAVLALILRPMASAISIGTLLMAPAFGFMGVGFPRLGMNAFAQGWGLGLPGTWYLMARIDQTLRGAPPEMSVRPVLMLAAMVVGLSAVAAWRLDRHHRHGGM